MNLNGAPIENNILSNDKFSIGNISSFNKYISGDNVKETYIHIKKKFSSFEERFFAPLNEEMSGQSLNMKKEEKELFQICIITLHYFYLFIIVISYLLNKFYIHYFKFIDS